MKQLLLILVLSAAALSAGARITVYKSTIEDRVAKARQHNTLSNAKLDMKGDNIVFKGLPSKNMEYYVIDANGNVARSGTMNRKNNKLDMNKLPKGSNTIALKQGENIKVFGWLEEVVVKG